MPDRGSSWQLWRQDDNGVSVLIAEYDDHKAALEAMSRFESHHHKQTYWIVECKSDESHPQPKSLMPHPNL